MSSTNYNPESSLNFTVATRTWICIYLIALLWNGMFLLINCKLWLMLMDNLVYFWCGSEMKLHSNSSTLLLEFELLQWNTCEFLKCVLI